MPLTKRLIKVPPNVLTWFSLIFAIFAGVSVYYIHKWPYAYLLAILFISLNSMFDLLDGDVARLTGRSSKRGDFLDHTFDRYSDLAIVLGMVLSPICSLKWGVIAIAGMLLVSYMGTQAQAMGVGRIYGGLLGRADRLFILVLFGLGEFILGLREQPWTLDYTLFGVRIVENSKFFGLYLFTIAMISFSVAGHYTAIYRGVKTWQYLGVKSDEKEEGK